MNELSIEEKAKAYDKATKYAHYLINERCKEGTDGSFHRADLDKMFPTLKESEDDRIRREIVDFINRVYERQALIITDEEKANWIAWLEKQGEQKSKTIFLKFRIDDKVTNGKDTYTIDSIGKDCYWVKEHCCVTIPFEYQHYWKLVKQNTAWSEKDEKIYSRIYDLIHDAAYANYDVDEDGKELGEYAKITDWLKSLKYRYTWKPSDLQIEALESATANCAYSEYEDCLTDLIKELKK